MAGSAPEEPTAPAGCPKAFWSNRCDVVDAAVRATARRLGLQPAEAEDLRSEVWLKLLSSTVVHQQFQGRSSLATYLVSIAKRVVLDSRAKDHGRWRPAGRSRRMGRVAVELDRLVRLDGYTMSQALQTVRSKELAIGDAQSFTIFVSCGRNPMRRRADPALLESLPSPPPSPDHLVVAAEMDRTAADAARQKQLYRRLERVLVTIRRRIQDDSVTKTRIGRLLDASMGAHPASGLPEVLIGPLLTGPAQ